MILFQKIEFIATTLMIGVIWQVQLVTYPLLKKIIEENIQVELFQKLHHFYTTRITWIVLPLMVVEIFLCLYNTLKNPVMVQGLLLILTLCIWMVTFFISVPIHGKLANSPDKEIANRLVVTNWLRTILWTIKGLIILYIIT